MKGERDGEKNKGEESEGVRERERMREIGRESER